MAWLIRNRGDRDSQGNRARHDEIESKRWSQVLWSGSAVEGADPDEVEARLSNLSHGTYRE